MTELDYEKISLFLPQYLNPDERRGLFDELKRFPAKIRFYDVTEAHKESLLQGDGWRDFVAIDFQTTAKKSVSGVIISNSCDISTANERDISPNILFAPIIKLEKFACLLR